ncbi:MAG: MCE family protein [Bdellovibrionales bacterium]|nr:MCE family protein [Bdellovibrionales bacterium]MBT3526470.1 MCE family protein [Bdellovibrionales bacterium]MBT7765920.1 MCE family protein [Bdellovibrionales bacterium]
MIALVAMGYMSLKLTDNKAGFGEYIPYRSIISDASGIFPKTPIKVAGINAGRILDIQLQGDNALILFEVVKRVKVVEGSAFRIKTVGFLGDKYIEIEMGDGERVIPPNSLIKTNAGGGFENIVRDASEILVEVKEIVASLRESITPRDQVPPVTQILTDVKQTVKNAEEMTRSLRNLVTNNETKMQKMVDDLARFTHDLKGAVDPLNQDGTLGKINSKVDGVDQILANIQKASKDLELTMRDVRELVQDIKGGKGTLGQILTEDQIADEVKETLSGVRKIVGKVDAIRTELSVYSGINTESGGQSIVALKLFPSPERFYQLGLSTSEWGLSRERRTTTVTDGVESIQLHREEQKEGYQFDIQVARKVHNWSIRGGLFESTGGVGVDYEKADWGTLVSLMIFDYRDNFGPNLRLSTDSHVWNVFYGRFTFDDMLTENRSWTVSVGMRFLDEDLKGLMGFFF